MLSYLSIPISEYKSRGCLVAQARQPAPHHFFNASCQFSTTVMGVEDVAAAVTLKRNFLPSGATSQRCPRVTVPPPTIGTVNSSWGVPGRNVPPVMSTGTDINLESGE